MKQHSFTDFVYEVIGELRQENRFATAYIYHYALQAFTASVGGGKIFWGGLNRRSLCKFQYYLEKEQKSYNTTSTYIRALRAIYNRAVDRGVVAGECRLFVNLKTGVSSEHKLALTAGQTSRLLGDVVDGKYSSGRLSSPVLPSGGVPGAGHNAIDAVAARDAFCRPCSLAQSGFERGPADMPTPKDGY